jgi:hypothetical protein
MRIKLELTALTFGIVATAIELSILLFWDSIPTGLREVSRGGNVGGVVLGLFTIIGLFGTLLFPINLLGKERKYWAERGLAVFCFLILLASIGARV